MKTVRFEKGDIIFDAGDVGDCMYRVVGPAGTCVEIYRDYEKESQTSLALCMVGGFFGEMSVASGEPRSATAVALEDVELEVISKEDFEELKTKDPQMLMDILSNISGRLRELTKQYLEAGMVASRYFDAVEGGNKPDAELESRMQKFVKW